MGHAAQNSLSTVNTAILEFLRSSQEDLTELKAYLKRKYKVSFSEAALKERIQRLTH